MLRTKNIKKALEYIGATNIDIKNNYHYKSGFFDYKGKLMYLSTGDDRINLGGIVRTARDRKDFIGGVNNLLYNWFSVRDVELIK